MSEFNIKAEFAKEKYFFLCSEDKDIISAAPGNCIDLPSSCCSGACTKYASIIIDGAVEQEDAMGLNDDLKEKGFAHLCVNYPTSKLHIMVGDEVEENLYNNEFGKYQK